MGKVIRVGSRGTSRRISEKSEDNWSGEDFKEYQRKRKEALGDAYVTVGRGTTKIKLSDLKESKSTSTKGRYVSMGRGTGRRKLD